MMIYLNEFSRNLENTNDNLFILQSEEKTIEQTALHISIEKNFDSIVQILLEAPEIDSNIKSINNVKRCIKKRRESNISDLLKTKYKIKDQNYIRKFSQNCIQFSIYNKDYSDSSNESEISNEKSQLDSINQQIMQKEKSNSNDYYIFKERELNQERTSLYLAIKNNNHSIIKLLLANKNIDLNLMSKIQSNKNTKFINKKETKNVFCQQLKSEINEEKTSLHAAIGKGNLELVQLLLENTNLDVNIKSVVSVKNESGKAQIKIDEFDEFFIPENSYKKCNQITPLCFAVMQGTIDIVKLLRSHAGLDSEAKSDIQFKKDYKKLYSLENKQDIVSDSEIDEEEDNNENEFVSNFYF